MFDIEMTRVRSSTVHSIGYDAESETLRVKFNSGSVYEYYNVPESVVERFFNAHSKGMFLNDRIKDIYRFRKVK